MDENDVAKIVVDAAYHIHVELGPGLLESVYETVLAAELAKRGLKVERQKPITFEFRGVRFDEGFRADLVVNELVVVELKSTEQSHPVHKKQVKTYLKLSGKRLGLLLNFGTELVKDGVARVVLGLPDS
jgi:GxxExxY protein